MGNKFSVTQKQLLLTKTERDTVSSLWSRIQVAHPDLFACSWCAALDSDPGIAKLFLVDKGEDPAKNHALQQTIEEVEVFFDRIIVRHGFDAKICKRECRALGGRHVSYSLHGFKPYHWDLFSACLMRTAEEILMLSGRQRFQFLMAWRRLVTYIVNEMRTGYEQQKLLRYPDV